MLTSAGRHCARPRPLSATNSRTLIHTVRPTLYFDSLHYAIGPLAWNTSFHFIGELLRFLANRRHERDQRQEMSYSYPKKQLVRCTVLEVPVSGSAGRATKAGGRLPRQAH